MKFAAESLVSMDARYNPRSLEHRGLDTEAFKRSFLEGLVYTVGKDTRAATRRDWFTTSAFGVRDRLVDRWMETTRNYYKADAKRVYYLSLEFLIGRLMTNSLANLGVMQAVGDALDGLGLRLDDIIDMEPDAALGNGGLGRLAACYLDSMATLGLPGYGYGIRYEHGIFRQDLVDGRQVERPDNWLRDENPWEIARPDRTYRVKFYGRVNGRVEGGRVHYEWVDSSDVLAMAYDVPVPGYCNNTVNTLRLWGAKATEEFDIGDFMQGDYSAAVEAKSSSETISKVLYPPADSESGRELRLKQQYLLVTATLQDIVQ